MYSVGGIMPGIKPIKSDSWRWFRAELDRLLGPAQAAALFAELTRRRHLEYQAEQRRRAAKELPILVSARDEAQAAGKGTARLEQMIERRRELLGEEGLSG